MYKAIPTVINSGVFENCTSLTSAAITGFNDIKDNLFKGDISLTDAKVSISGTGINMITGEPNTIARTVAIGNNTFYGCQSLVNLTFDDSVKTVGTQTFLGCKNLKTVTLGTGFASGLSYEDFSNPVKGNANDLLKVLKNGIDTELKTFLNDEHASFESLTCTKLEAINVPSENKSFISENGILYNANHANLLYVPYNTTASVIEVPATTKTISEYAAYMNPKITTFTMDSGTSDLTIGQNAFYRTSLKTVQFNRKGKINLNQYAFANSENLSSLSVAYNHGGTLGNYAFINCDALKDLTIKGFVSLGTYAFAFCDNLTNILVSEGIATFGEHVFANNYKLVKADLYEASTNADSASAVFKTYVFAEDYSLKEVLLPKGLLGISSYTFDNCHALEKVTVYVMLQSIEPNAFKNTEKFTTLTGIKYLAAIDKSAFNNCPALRELEVTRALVNIADGAFIDCPNLSIKAPQGSDAIKYAQTKGIKTSYNQNTIEDWEFLVYSPATKKGDYEYTMGMPKVDIPAYSLAASGASPLQDDLVVSGYMGGFHSLDLTDSDHLYSKVFYTSWLGSQLGDTDCNMSKYLESINFGKAELILRSAFSNAQALKTIEFGQNMRYIGDSAFSGCKALTGTLYLPFSLEMVETGAFQNCTALTKVDTDFRDESVINGNLVASELKIAKNAFLNCSSLKSFNTSFTTYEVAHPSASVKYYLKEIGETAFKNCTSLASVYFNGNLEKIAPKAFEGCTSLKTVTLDNSVLVQTNAFAGCTNLTNAIIVGEANVAISNNPFCDSNELTVATTDASKAQSYIDYKKNTNPSGNYSIQLRTFDTINGKAYLKSKVVAPSNVRVYKDGKLMNTSSETVIYTNILKFECSDAVGSEDEDNFVYYINGKAIFGRTYTLTEFEPEILNITVTRKPSILPGDVDCDGSITASDAAFVLQKALISTFEMPSDKKVSNPLDVSDVDCDGTITASDAAFILQKALVSTFELPAEKKYK